ncbi:MAG: histidine kinase dimerization/phospho-acceptor domain-containing protein [Myxococcota bacterium]
MAWATDLQPLVGLLAPVDIASLVLSESGATFAVFDAHGRVLYVSDALMAVLAALGFAREGVVGRLVSELEVNANPAGQAALAHWAERVAAVAASRARGEIHDEGIVDGERHHVVSTLVPRLDASGQVTAIVAIARSGTLWADGLRRLPLPASARAGDGDGLASELHLPERLASLAHIAAGVVHEVSNPLTSIYGNVDHVARAIAALREAHPELRAELDPLVEPLAEAQGGAERIRRVVEDIGLLARSEAAASPKVDLREIVRSVLRLVGSDMERRALLTYDAGGAPFVAGGAVRVGLLATELLLHALGALPARPTYANAVAIEVGRAGDDAVLTVRDNGIGVPGGPRMAIAQGLVASLGGRIEVTPTAGIGTVVRVVLPGSGDAAD